MSELRHTPNVPPTMPYTEEDKELARRVQREAAERIKAKRIKAAIASVAGGGVLLAGGYFAGKVLGGGETSVEPEVKSPSVGASANPSGTEAPASPLETGKGMQLSSEEVADFTSGDPERIASVVDERVLPSLRAVFDHTENATPEPGIFDAEAQEAIDGILELIEKRREGDSSEYFGTYICPMSPEEEGGTCDGLETSITPDVVKLGAAIRTDDYWDSRDGYRINFTIPQLSAIVTADGKFYLSGDLDK